MTIVLRDMVRALYFGAFIVLGIMLLCRKLYNNFLKIRDLIIIVPILTVAGAAGAYLMYFIEAGKFNGVSFYGAAFLIPLITVIPVKMFKIDYGKLTDSCSPGVCAMCSVVKINCLIKGCCQGIVLYVKDDGQYVRFPSQITEFSAALVISAALTVLIGSKKLIGKVYPLFMIIYGITKFAFSLFRETTPFVFGLSAGSFWSVISVLAGVIWLVVLTAGSKKERKSGSRG